MTVEFLKNVTSRKADLTLPLWKHFVAGDIDTCVYVSVFASTLNRHNIVIKEWILLIKFYKNCSALRVIKGNKLVMSASNKYLISSKLIIEINFKGSWKTILKTIYLKIYTIFLFC